MIQTKEIKEIESKRILKGIGEWVVFEIDNSFLFVCFVSVKILFISWSETVISLWKQPVNKFCISTYRWSYSVEHHL